MLTDLKTDYFQLWFRYKIDLSISICRKTMEALSGINTFPAGQRRYFPYY